MKKGFLFFFSAVIYTTSVVGASRLAPNKFINKALYDNIYPSTLNQSKNSDGIPIVQSAKQKSNDATSSAPMGKRNISKRTTNARAATNSASTISAKNTMAQTTRASASSVANQRHVVPRATTARSGTKTSVNQVARNVSNRRIVARGTPNVNSARSARLVRSMGSTQTQTQTQTATSSQRCFADYKKCMDSYCDRTEVAYDRCYCSAKLAQIDSKYQPKIDSLIQEIIRLKYNTDATDAEIKEYWNETVGVYTGTNPWVNIDNALNIDWADTETRFRGQNAFSAGHTYCVNHLRACSYMASNLRDAYKSEIERDCSTYEKTLERIQMAAESVIESYDE